MNKTHLKKLMEALAIKSLLSTPGTICMEVSVEVEELYSQHVLNEILFIFKLDLIQISIYTYTESKRGI